MSEKLFHISEEPDIEMFNPRPSPSYFPQITTNVVFAINNRMLHNYLLPRDCPRVTWYAGSETSADDQNSFCSNSAADYFIAIESAWFDTIRSTVLYIYEFNIDNFIQVDECAGYYITDRPVKPVNVMIVRDVFKALLERKVEVRITPSLLKLADAISKTTLKFSMIRMRNAK